MIAQGLLVLITFIIWITFYITVILCNTYKNHSITMLEWGTLILFSLALTLTLVRFFEYLAGVTVTVREESIYNIITCISYIEFIGYRLCKEVDRKDFDYTRFSIVTNVCVTLFIIFTALTACFFYSAISNEYIFSYLKG